MLVRGVERRCALATRLLPPGATPPVAGVVRALLEMGFAWGVSDGN